jgi:serine/threonine protein phosphatase PrpC
VVLLDIFQDFASVAGTVLCGVFDGHGPHGHLVAKNVGSILPDMLALSWNIQDLHGDSSPDSSEPLLGAWKDSLIQAYNAMDLELLRHADVDSFSSGTTAVILVRQVRWDIHENTCRFLRSF